MAEPPARAAAIRCGRAGCGNAQIRGVCGVCGISGVCGVSGETAVLLVPCDPVAAVTVFALDAVSCHGPALASGFTARYGDISWLSCR